MFFVQLFTYGYIVILGDCAGHGVHGSLNVAEHFVILAQLQIIDTMTN